MSLTRSVRVSRGRSRRYNADEKLVNMIPGGSGGRDQIGSRRIISYLLSPVLRYKREVLRER